MNRLLDTIRLARPSARGRPTRLRTPGSTIGAGTRQATSASPARSSEPGARVAAAGAESAPGEPSTPEPYFSPTAEFTVAGGVRDVGMVFVGASTTAGYGDPKGLGWVGRVVARTQHPDLDLTAYNLGIRGNTSGDVVARWAGEAHPRWKGRSERRLVLSFGTADIRSGMTMARSRLNLANVARRGDQRRDRRLRRRPDPVPGCGAQPADRGAGRGTGGRLRPSRHHLRRLLPPTRQPRPVDGGPRREPRPRAPRAGGLRAHRLARAPQRVERVARDQLIAPEPYISTPVSRPSSARPAGVPATPARPRCSRRPQRRRPRR